MLGFSLAKIVEILIVLLVPAATVLLGDRSVPLPARLALGLGLVGGLLFLVSVLSGHGGEDGYLVAATVGLGLGGLPYLTSP
jgi:hypothetical protein